MKFIIMGGFIVLIGALMYLFILIVRKGLE